MSEWEDYHRAMSRLAAEMIGAGNYFDAHPDCATDERLASTFREYVARMRAVEVPGVVRSEVTA